jgi:hypothetical protein
MQEGHSFTAGKVMAGRNPSAAIIVRCLTALFYSIAAHAGKQIRPLLVFPTRQNHHIKIR